jgi:dephospho-CoA kinase
MKRIGITGGICSGKSTICREIEAKGYPIFYSDIVARDLANNCTDLKNEIISVFGDESYIDGEYNAKYISSIVFTDEVKLKIINDMYSWRIRDEWEKFIIDKEVAFFESALIFEHEIDGSFDYIICVYCDENVVIDRLKKRNGFDDVKINNILNSQLPPKIKSKLSNYVIDTTNGNYNVDEILKLIL